MPNGASHDCKPDVRDPTLIEEEAPDDVDFEDGHDGKDEEKDDADENRSVAGDDGSGCFDFSCALLVGLRESGLLFWG